MVKTESDALYSVRHPRLGLERLRDFDSALGSSKQHILVSNILRVGKGMAKIGGVWLPAAVWKQSLPPSSGSCWVQARTLGSAMQVWAG